MVRGSCGVAGFLIGGALGKGDESGGAVRMAVGDSVSVGGYAFRFDGVQSVTGPNYRAARGPVSVSRNGGDGGARRAQGGGR